MTQNVAGDFTQYSGSTQYSGLESLDELVEWCQD